MTVDLPAPDPNFRYATVEPWRARLSLALIASILLHAAMLATIEIGQAPATLQAESATIDLVLEAEPLGAASRTNVRDDAPASDPPLEEVQPDQSVADLPTGSEPVIPDQSVDPVLHDTPPPAMRSPPETTSTTGTQSIGPGVLALTKVPSPGEHGGTEVAQAIPSERPPSAPDAVPPAPSAALQRTDQRSIATREPHRQRQTQRATALAERQARFEREDRARQRADRRAEAASRQAARLAAGRQASRAGERAQDRASSRGTAQVAAPPPSWLAQVRARIASGQTYPARARDRGDSGTARVAMVVSRSGSLASARLAGSSGSTIIDQEAVALVRRVSPFPPFPTNVAAPNISIIVPIAYRLRD